MRNLLIKRFFLLGKQGLFFCIFRCVRNLFFTWKNAQNLLFLFQVTGIQSVDDTVGKSDYR